MACLFAKYDQEPFEECGGCGQDTNQFKACFRAVAARMNPQQKKFASEFLQRVIAQRIHTDTGGRRWAFDPHDEAKFAIGLFNSTTWREG